MTLSSPGRTKSTCSIRALSQTALRLVGHKLFGGEDMTCILFTPVQVRLISQMPIMERGYQPPTSANAANVSVVGLFLVDNGTLL